MQVQPYLCFNGRCDEALELYKKIFNTKVDFLMRFSEGPPGSCEGASMPANWGDKVMHSSFRIGGTTVMASDGRCEGKPSFQGFALALSVPTEAEADRQLDEVLGKLGFKGWRDG